jgi:hypothetical protein
MFIVTHHVFFLHAVMQAMAFSPVAHFFRSGAWKRWGVEYDDMESLSPYTWYRNQDPNVITYPKEADGDFRDLAKDPVRPYYGPIFWIIFEEILPDLTHFNGILLVSPAPSACLWETLTDILLWAGGVHRHGWLRR